MQADAVDMGKQKKKVKHVAGQKSFWILEF